MTYDLVAHLHRQREFSLRAFGPGERVESTLQHIAKELDEVRADPQDITEWIDIVLLGLDGAMRAGNDPEVVAAYLRMKLSVNENRDWPDWRSHPTTQAIEHVKKEV